MRLSLDVFFGERHPLYTPVALSSFNQGASHARVKSHSSSFPRYFAGRRGGLEAALPVARVQAERDRRAVGGSQPPQCGEAQVLVAAKFLGRLERGVSELGGELRKE